MQSHIAPCCIGCRTLVSAKPHCSMLYWLLYCLWLMQSHIAPCCIGCCTLVSAKPHCSMLYWLLYCLWLMMLMVNLFRLIYSQGRELYLHYFIKCSFDIGFHQNACELICFKLGMMQDTTKLQSMIPVYMTVDTDFSQGHKIMEQ